MWEKMCSNVEEDVQECGKMGMYVQDVQRYRKIGKIRIAIRPNQLAAKEEE